MTGLFAPERLIEAAGIMGASGAALAAVAAIVANAIRKRGGN